MARLSDQLIGRIKQEVSLLALVQAKGFKLKPHGQDYVMCCPWHDDDTPSLVISPDTNLWHCMGACQSGGSVIDWIMKTEGVSFRHAVELLKNDLPHLAAESSGEPKVIKQNTKPKLPTPLAANADQQTALSQVITYYHNTLKESPEALEYLESRGLNHPELITHFKLGFANRTLAYRLPQKNRKEGAEVRGLLQEVGILRESGHEHFNGSIVVPVFDQFGKISEIYGRKLLGKRLRKGTPQHTYLPGAHQGVWNSNALAVSKEIILCESLIDAMTFWVHGFRHVTASYGTSGFTDDHLNAFKQNGIERVYIAYDRDEAGNNAADKLALMLMQAGIDCFRVLFPKGMDVNEYAQQVQPAQKSLELVIRKAEWMGNGIKLDAMPTEETLREAAKQENNDTISSLAATSLVAEVPAHPIETNDDTDTEITDSEITITLNDRRYRIRGLQKNMSYEQLKLNLLVSCGDGFHVDTFDIYSARHRTAFIKQASAELSLNVDVLKKDLGRVLLKLEELQDQQIKDILEKKEKAPSLSDEELHEALQLLKDPTLLDRILEDFNAAGVVGEETNKLVGYLAGVSRKLSKPLAVIIQSTSAAGKSALMDAVLAMMPDEEAVCYSAMSGQSLFYMGETNLKHKILAIAEEEGAESASYALKVLQSDGQLTMASTGKDATTGKLVTQEYHVEGPVMIFLTTTAIEIDEELLNRCIVLTVNESREQTEAIHAIQRSRQALEGLLADQDRKDIIQLHNNAQRLLRPLMIANPYAEQLTFMSDKTRTRRDHMKYLTLINTVTLLHQYQREIKQVKHKGKTLEYIEVTINDIDVANRLANEVLGRSLDELPPQTRNMLTELQAVVKNACEQEGIAQHQYLFTRASLRQQLGWSYDQVRVHLDRLIKLEYVLVHRGDRGHSFVYELLYDGKGQTGEPFLNGLLDTKQLKSKRVMQGLGGKKEEVGVPLGTQWGRGGEVVNAAPAQQTKDLQVEGWGNDQKRTLSPKKHNGASHHSDTVPSLAATEG